MIEDKEILCADARYLWSHDESIESHQYCWSWANAETYMAPPQGLVSQLNRVFIDECAADVAGMLEDSEDEHFGLILKHMGASDDDIDNLGLRDVLIKLYPEKAPSRFVENMPAASHGPLNSPVVRNWFFAPNLFQVAPPSPVSCLGFSPFDLDDLSEFLGRNGIVTCDLNESGSVVLLGRKGWSEREVNALIDRRVGGCLRIYVSGNVFSISRYLYRSVLCSDGSSGGI